MCRVENVQLTSRWIKQTATVLDLDASTPVIPEAFFVEDDDEKDVAMGECVPPFWKRKRFYADVFVVLVIIVRSIAGGMRYVQARSSTFQLEMSIVFVTNETLNSAPTSSLMPSFRPSACIDHSSNLYAST